jgi:hypothetical protein
LPLATGGFLVLQGYELQEISRDSTLPYKAKDAIKIHDGDHIHDPCTKYLSNGERFMLEGSSAEEGKGFVVINDCQVVECTKWKNNAEGTFGGETVTYDLVKLDDSTKLTKTWKITSDLSSCSCDSQGIEPLPRWCHVGKFNLVDFWDPSKCRIDVDEGVSPIACTLPATPWVGSGHSDKNLIDRFVEWEDEVDWASKAVIGVLAASAVCLIGHCLGACYYYYDRGDNVELEKLSIATDDAVLEVEGEDEVNDTNSNPNRLLSGLVSNSTRLGKIDEYDPPNTPDP